MAMYDLPADLLVLVLPGELQHQLKQLLVGLETHVLKIAQVLDVATLEVLLELVAGQLLEYSKPLRHESYRVELGLLDYLPDVGQDALNVLFALLIPVVIDAGAYNDTKTKRRVQLGDLLAGVTLKVKLEELAGCTSRQRGLSRFQVLLVRF